MNVFCLSPLVRGKQSRPWYHSMRPWVISAVAGQALCLMFFLIALGGITAVAGQASYATTTGRSRTGHHRGCGASATQGKRKKM